jgi:hypothetical protein
MVGSTPSEIDFGIHVHELIGKLYELRSVPPTVDDVQTVIDDLGNQRRRPDSMIELERNAIVHGYARIVIPWVLDKHEVVSVEEEFSLDLGDDIVWMARPDVIVKSRETGLPSIVELKTTQSKAETIAPIHSGSLQSVMNAYAVSTKYGRCEAVQIHVLQRGTDKWPTPLTHAWYRAANPPFVSEDWRPRKEKGKWLKGYRLVEVAKFRPVADWIWSMDPAVLAEYVGVAANPLDPQVQGRKVAQAIASIKRNESRWRDDLSSVTDWSRASRPMLDATFPRTFHCIQYNRACEWQEACFGNSADQANLLIDTEWLHPRKPHHPQEGEQ